MGWSALPPRCSYCRHPPRSECPIQTQLAPIQPQLESMERPNQTPADRHQGATQGRIPSPSRPQHRGHEKVATPDPPTIHPSTATEKRGAPSQRPAAWEEGAGGA